MKKPIIIVLLAVVLTGFLAISWMISTNNRLVSMDENVKSKWSQVENVYQRRADLVPNLVNTVKGYAKHEARVLEEVTKARAQVGQVQATTPDPKNAGAVKEYDRAQTQLTQALSRLLVVVERYPDLKANKNFQELQSQLEGTENRIAVERKRFNEAAQEYNSYLRRFPQNLVASFRGFEPRPYFASEPGAATVPKVEF